MGTETKKQTMDQQLFQQEMQDVVPLNTPPTSNSKTPRGASRTRVQQRTTPPGQNTTLPSAGLTERSGRGDIASHRKNGVQARMLQKLRRGHYPPGDQLDLHHETMAAARAMLQDFIADAQCRRLQCIRVIHGKGLRSEAGPVLKNMVHQTLCEHAGVLAFTTLKPADGGSGAVDVLLRAS
jgi:DNA-nicking Smr family endonuclease